LAVIDQLIKEQVQCAAFVTHNPLVSLLAATLLGASSPVIDFRRGAVAIFELFGAQLPARLKLYLPPSR
jgi:phosphohistidine phosphatase SixA